MPPEQEDRTRQLQAIQRYVADLYEQRGRPDAQPPEGGRRPGGWLLLTAALVSLALVGGVLIGAVAWSEDRTAGERGAGAFKAAEPASSAAARLAAPECKTAVDRANKSLALAAKVEDALAEHTRIMNDLLNGKIDGGTALRTGTPSLVSGASDSAKFDVALADYQQVVKQCRLRAP